MPDDDRKPTTKLTARLASDSVRVVLAEHSDPLRSGIRPNLGSDSMEVGSLITKAKLGRVRVADFGGRVDHIMPQVDPAAAAEILRYFEELRRRAEQEEQAAQELRRIALSQPIYIRVARTQMSGRGSDLDEVYGSIYVNTRMQNDQGSWDYGLLNGSNDVHVGEVFDFATGSVDLENKVLDRQKSITMIQKSYESHKRIQAEIYFRLFDEDGGRDWGKGFDSDDAFMLEAPTNLLWKERNALRYSYDAPGIEQPAFMRETRFVARLAADGDTITVGLHIKIWRELPR